MSVQRIGRRGLLGALALGLAAGVALRSAPQPALAQTTQTSPVVLAPIETLGQSLLTVMKEGHKTPFAQRVQALAPSIENALNIPEILREAVGPGWSQLTPEQQSRLLSAFRQYTVATFVENFDSYDGQTISVSPTTRPLSGGAQVVRTTITSANGQTTHTIDYVMRQTSDGAWKATDVLADGTISRVAVLRSDFASMLEHGGAPALEASLQEKTQKLENG
ncbi:MAG TPA: ABC transporter substrate-binding protein [Acetobacteraceae bacterium]|nr:ABC transporter substrate-binding protein [Acetobacteraceae bacterium]